MSKMLVAWQRTGPDIFSHQGIQRRVPCSIYQVPPTSPLTLTSFLILYSHAAASSHQGRENENRKQQEDLRLLTKREKTWFFPLCGYQAKTNKLIFLVFEVIATWLFSNVLKFVISLIFVYSAGEYLELRAGMAGRVSQVWHPWS